MSEQPAKPEEDLTALVAQRLRARNRAVMAILVGFALAIFVITLIRVRP